MVIRLIVGLSGVVADATVADDEETAVFSASPGRDSWALCDSACIVESVSDGLMGKRWKNDDRQAKIPGPQLRSSSLNPVLTVASTVASR